MRYEIRTDGANGSLWGWARTIEKARTRAAKLSKSIRSDIAVCIVANGTVIEKSGVSSMFSGFERPTSPV